tara:strand:- start:414 stop:689 length:276 start_codon:yes stop_codon:yes gene_type:complete
VTTVGALEDVIACAIARDGRRQASASTLFPVVSIRLGLDNARTRRGSQWQYQQAQQETKDEAAHHFSLPTRSLVKNCDGIIARARSASDGR